MARRASYDPVKYWDSRGEKYTDDIGGIARPLFAIMDAMNDGNTESVLDIGSGWGRVYSFFRESGYGGAYEMCDISSTMIEQCEKRTGKRPTAWDGKTLPYKPSEFDAVFLIHVLQHCRKAIPVLLEAARVSNRVFVVDNVPVDKNMSSHCFHHDWLLAFAKSGLLIDRCLVFDAVIMLWELRKK